MTSGFRLTDSSRFITTLYAESGPLELATHTERGMVSGSAKGGTRRFAAPVDFGVHVGSINGAEPVVDFCCADTEVNVSVITRRVVFR